MPKFFSCDLCKQNEFSDEKCKKTKKCKCRGKRGHTGPPGQDGSQGSVGPVGPVGPTGPSGGILSAADFYALMPGDNSATVAVGGYVQFPENGEFVGTDITRNGSDSSSFQLGPIGVYQVLFQVSVSEAGQLQLNLNNNVIQNSVVGRATGTSQIVGMSLIRTTTTNSILRIQNPSGNSSALTITPLAGGSSPVSAHVVITLLSVDSAPV